MRKASEATAVLPHPPRSKYVDLIRPVVLQGRPQLRHQLQPVAQDDRCAAYRRPPHGIGRGAGRERRLSVVVVLGDVLVPGALKDAAVALRPPLGRSVHRSAMCWSRPAWYTLECPVAVARCETVAGGAVPPGASSSSSL